MKIQLAHNKLVSMNGPVPSFAQWQSPVSPSYCVRGPLDKRALSTLYCYLGMYLGYRFVLKWFPKSIAKL